MQIVSFEKLTDTSECQCTIMRDSLPRMNDTVAYSRLLEIKNLTFSQVDELTDILYNYGYGGPITIMSYSQCYRPSNAILFIDSLGKAFEFIEICFECSITKESSERISLGDDCDEKMEMLKKFFKKSGIEYGIVRGLITDEY